MTYTPSAAEVKALSGWHLSPTEIGSLHEVMVDAVAWQLIELTMDTADRSPSAEDLNTARDDARKWLIASHTVRAEVVGEQIAQAIERSAGEARGDVRQTYMHAVRIARTFTTEETPPVSTDPCDAEIHSWDYFTSQQVDSYWIHCTKVGPHDEHSDDGNTGAHWTDNEETNHG